MQHRIQTAAVAAAISLLLTGCTTGGNAPDDTASAPETSAIESTTDSGTETRAETPSSPAGEASAAPTTETSADASELVTLSNGLKAPAGNASWTLIEAIDNPNPANHHRLITMAYSHWETSGAPGPPTTPTFELYDALDGLYQSNLVEGQEIHTALYEKVAAPGEANSIASIQRIENWDQSDRPAEQSEGSDIALGPTTQWTVVRDETLWGVQLSQESTQDEVDAIIEIVETMMASQ